MLASLRRPQLLRLQQLVAWLKAERPFNCRTAAAEFQVSRRTLSDDLERLRALGVPFDYDPRRRTFYLTEPFDALPSFGRTTHRSRPVTHRKLHVNQRIPTTDLL